MKNSIFIIVVGLLASPLTQAQVTEAQVFTKDYSSLQKKITQKTSHFINSLFNNDSNEQKINHLVYDRSKNFLVLNQKKG